MPEFKITTRQLILSEETIEKVGTDGIKSSYSHIFAEMLNKDPDIIKKIEKIGEMIQGGDEEMVLLGATLLTEICPVWECDVTETSDLFIARLRLLARVSVSLKRLKRLQP